MEIIFTNNVAINNTSKSYRTIEQCAAGINNSLYNIMYYIYIYVYICIVEI